MHFFALFFSLSSNICLSLAQLQARCQHVPDCPAASYQVPVAKCPAAKLPVAKCQCLLCQDLSCQVPEILAEDNFSFTKIPLLKPPTPFPFFARTNLFPSPLDMFGLFGVLNLPLLNKEISKRTCLFPCPSYLTSSSFSFIICKLRYLLLYLWYLPLQKGPAGHLATIYRMLIVSDGRGSKKEEGKST